MKKSAPNNRIGAYSHECVACLESVWLGSQFCISHRDTHKEFVGGEVNEEAHPHNILEDLDMSSLVGPPLIDSVFSLPENKSLCISLHAYEITLRTAFGTNHSTSTSRLNGLLRLQLEGAEGKVGEEYESRRQVFAEVGLPPKKAFVYEADLTDIHTYVEAYCTQLDALLSIDEKNLEDNGMAEVLFHTPDFSFPRLRSPPQSESEAKAFRIFCVMLRALDTCPLKEESFSRAASSLIEVAATALLAECLCVSVSQLLLGEVDMSEGIGSGVMKHKHSSFYTTALNEDISEMVASAAFGAQHTPHLKVKLDGDAERCTAILAALDNWSSTTSSSSSSSVDDVIDNEKDRWWSLDANCAWSAPLALTLSNELLPNYSHRIKMVEQPFPVHLVFRAAEMQKMEIEQSERKDGGDMEELNQWISVKAAMNAIGIDVYADESMRTHEDIAALAPYVNGVNIKMEKVGGYRAALRAVACAKEARLKIWFGCMVGSNLNSTQTAALAPLADGGSDLDGSLLVTEDSKVFTNGFQFGPKGTVILDTIPGLGVTLKPHIKAFE